MRKDNLLYQVDLQVMLIAFCRPKALFNMPICDSQPYTLKKEQREWCR